MSLLHFPNVQWAFVLSFSVERAMGKQPRTSKQRSLKKTRLELSHTWQGLDAREVPDMLLPMGFLASCLSWQPTWLHLSLACLQ